MRCSPADLAEKVLAFLRQRSISEVTAWEAPHLPGRLLDHLQANGIRTRPSPDPTVQVGLTGALAGVAESATLVLPGGEGRPLSASLLHPVHIAVLNAQDICQNLEQALSLPEVRQQSASALISGPSRTADIEMTLTMGVHGPKEVIVFCVGE